MNHVDGITLP